MARGTRRITEAPVMGAVRVESLEVLESSGLGGAVLGRAVAGDPVAALAAAQAAQSTADVAAKTWVQPSAPTIGSRPNAIEGDVWLDSDDGYREYVAAGGQWVKTRAIVPGGTSTPIAPTVSFSAAKRSLEARIQPQANLVYADGWDVQISRDNATWYCPNIAASLDSQDWRVGNAGDYLKIESPEFRISFLPIPLDGNSLPAAAGQDYYLRVRARCSSPAAVSSWTQSAALTVKPITGLDIATAQVTAALLAAGAAKGNLAVDGDVIAQGLKAISANLGVITAGKLRSADWVAGTSGFEIDLDTGEITNESGTFLLKANGELKTGTADSFIHVDPASGDLEISGFEMALTKSQVITNEGGTSLSHEGQSLVWRNSSGVEIARLSYNAVIDKLIPTKLGAMVRQVTQWTRVETYGAVASTSFTGWYSCFVKLPNGDILAVGEIGTTSQGGYQVWNHLTGAWSSVNVIGGDTRLKVRPCAVLRSDGTVLVHFGLSDGDLYDWRYGTDGQWTSLPSAYNAYTNGFQALVQLANGEIRVYSESSSLLKWKTRNSDGTWSAETSTGIACAYVDNAFRRSNGNWVLLIESTASPRTPVCVELSPTGTVLSTTGFGSSMYSHSLFGTELPDGSLLAFYTCPSPFKVYKVERSAAGVWGSASLNIDANYSLMGVFSLDDGATLRIFYDGHVDKDQSHYSGFNSGTFPWEAGAGFVEKGEDASGLYYKLGDNAKFRLGGAVSRYSRGSASVASGAIVPFPTPISDPQSLSPGASGTSWVIKEAGIYAVSAYAAASSSVYGNIVVRVNGSAVMSGTASATNMVSLVLYLAAGDTITLTNGNASAVTFPEGVIVIAGISGEAGSGPKGDKGDTGATGPQGPTGPKGDKGDTGATGPAGANGVTVPNISGLTACADPDADNDDLIIYDASAAAHKKVKPSQLTVSLATNATKWNGSTKTVSTSAPSGGVDGDIWIVI